jgi:hypothetical protein
MRRKNACAAARLCVSALIHLICGADSIHHIARPRIPGIMMTSFGSCYMASGRSRRMIQSTRQKCKLELYKKIFFYVYNIGRDEKVVQKDVGI